MSDWRVVVMAALAMLLLVTGLLALILPDSYEGPEFYRLDEQHAIRALDVLGVVLLALGCALAWGAGAVWQRQMRVS